METFEAIRQPLRDYAAEEILRDGGSIHIRAIRPDDRERLVDHFHRGRGGSGGCGLRGARRHLSDPEPDSSPRRAFVRRVARVAPLREGGTERIIGVGRYVTDAGIGATAETAFAVADAHQGR